MRPLVTQGVAELLLKTTRGAEKVDETRQAACRRLQYSVYTFQLPVCRARFWFFAGALLLRAKLQRRVAGKRRRAAGCISFNGHFAVRFMVNKDLL